jgi:DNA-binding MarR family transcriptional regulator
MAEQDPGVTPHYDLDRTAALLLRRAHQRNKALYAAVMPSDIAQPQFAVLARLLEVGPVTQNKLGRMTAMDAATVKGVVNRLVARRLLSIRRSPKDARVWIVDLTDGGRECIESLIEPALGAERQTLAALDPDERRLFLELLARVADPDVNGHGGP